MWRDAACTLIFLAIIRGLAVIAKGFVDYTRALFHRAVHIITGATATTSSRDSIRILTGAPLLLLADATLFKVARRHSGSAKDGGTRVLVS